MDPVAASRRGQSCEEVCDEHRGGSTCDPQQFRYVNSCDMLKRHFSCSSCDVNHGRDIPNFVDDAQDANHGKCLTQREAPTCDGGHPHTLRLCPCVPNR